MFRVHFMEYNAQYVHMKIDSLLDKGVFYLTMVYAFNGIHERAPLWDHLRKIAGQVQGPWAIAGDFNCVMSANERIGGNATAAEMDPFRGCMEDCEVVDIAVIGSLYTWNNKQRPEERIYSRLDRFLVNKAWCDHFPNLYAHFLPEGLFDHSPCLIGSNQRMKGKNSFKLVNKLKCLKPELLKFNMDGFSDIEQTTGILQKKVEGLQKQLGQDPTNLALIQQEYEASQELKFLSTAKDSFLYQKAKSLWTKEGDSNSAYFHNSIKKRKKSK
ncbi:uncharacterized protein LOC141614499 [Silene latifolia]|uniref:uncharacterized protein LOC141614499 n=1 Tax=Silene latifolia TaxID=37657 RepID=UPI003D777F2D